MATLNPFDLLDDDAEDPSVLIAAEQKKAAATPAKKAQPQAKTGLQAQQAKTAKLPSKPLPPTQAVREARSEGGQRGGRGYGRGSGARYYRDSAYNDKSFHNNGIPAGQGVPEEGDTERTNERRGSSGPRGPYHGGRRGGFNNGEAGDEDRPRRTFERRSGTGRGNELKREGSGRGNWGNQTDELPLVTEDLIKESEKLGDEKPTKEENGAEENKKPETEEKEPEDKEMTLEEYEKVLEEKRKALQALRTVERKVDIKEFEAMQQLSNKKDSSDIFIKLGSDKDRRKEAFEKEERAKKSLSINEFLKPAEGERYYSPGGRGRGRGRGMRGGFGGGGGSNVEAPIINDSEQFPTLGGK